MDWVSFPMITSQVLSKIRSVVRLGMNNLLNSIYLSGVPCSIYPRGTTTPSRQWFRLLWWELLAAWSILSRVKIYLPSRSRSFLSPWAWWSWTTFVLWCMIEQVWLTVNANGGQSCWVGKNEWGQGCWVGKKNKVMVWVPNQMSNKRLWRGFKRFDNWAITCWSNWLYDICGTNVLLWGESWGLMYLTTYKIRWWTSISSSR